MATLNPTLFKLKIMQSRCPIYTGQVLPLIKDKLRTNQEDSLNNAELEHPFYSVQSVSRQQRYSSGKGAGETYHLALMPVEWDAVNLSWGPCASVSPHPFDISISSEEMYDTFGVHTKHTSNKVGVGNTITKEVEKLFKKNKKYKEWLEKYQNIDFDRIVRSIAMKILRRNSFPMTKEDKEDIFQEAIGNVFSKRDIILQYDDSRGSFINFFWGCFSHEFVNLVRDFCRGQKKYKKVDLGPGGGEDPLSEEEQMSYLKKEKSEDTDSILSTKEMLEEFQKFLSTKYNADVLIAITKGFENSERRVDIAKDLGMSKENLNYHVKRFIGYLKEYAVLSKNETLLAAIEEGMLKKHKGSRVAADSDLISDIIKNYKDQSGQSERVGEEEKLAERVPVGSTIRIKRRELPSFEDLTKQVVQDPERSATQATKDVEAYLQEITSADELIEQDGKLIALRVHRQE